MIKYSLIKNEELTFGPIQWNPTVFQNELYSKGVVCTLPVEKGPPTSVSFNGGYRIFPTTIVSPALNLNEKISGYVLTFEEDMLYYAELKDVLSPKELSNKTSAKRVELSDTVKKLRRSEEESGITLSVENNLYVFATDRDSQSTLSITIQNMTETEIIKWKLPNNTWVSLTKEYMVWISKSISNHVQMCFGKENILNTKIDLLDINGLYAFDVAFEWDNA